jgi:hypothetical protein
MLFFSTISDPQGWMPIPWRAAERYLNVGQKTYRLSSFLPEPGYVFEKAKLESVSSEANVYLTGIKVATYVLSIGLLPLMALGVCTFYRWLFRAEVINTSQRQAAGGQGVARVSTLAAGPTPSARQQREFTANKVEQVIETLYKAKKEGLVACLFLGRKYEQSLPEKEGEIWCSLHPEGPRRTKMPDRLHIQMNYDDAEGLAQIAFLFNRIVVAPSILQYLEEPWDTLHTLLESSASSEVFVEAFSDEFGSIPGPRAEINAKRGSISLPQAELEAYRASWKGNAFEEWKEKASVETFKEELKKFIDVKEGVDDIQRTQMKNIIEATPEEQFKEQMEKKATVSYLSFEEHYIKTHGHRLPSDASTHHPINHYKDSLTEAIRNYLSRLFQDIQLCSGEAYPYLQGEEARSMDFWILRTPKPL